MNAPPVNIYLESCLEPLSIPLREENVTDVYINRPGEIWIEKRGGEVERHETPALTRQLLLRLARQIAAISAQGINREHPLLSAVLPTGERVQVIIPPATRGEPAIAIRKHGVSGLMLEDYRNGGAFGETQITTLTRVQQRQCLPTLDADPMTMLKNAVRQRRNILVSGGTSTGKTTFLNALLKEVPLHERLILIEDTPELQISHANSVGLLSSRSALGEAKVSPEDLLIASLRMRPDRIILGEIRGSEAGTFLRAVNTGHPGSLTSIHADSPARAIDQLALLVLQTGIRMSWEDVVTYVNRSIDLIVQLRRGESGREIEEIMLVA